MSWILGIISDTHGNVARTRSAVAAFRKNGVQEVLHCGDIGTTAVIDILAELQVPVHYVFGNCDCACSALRSAMLRHGHTCYDYVGMIAREGKRIAWLHGHDWNTMDDLLYNGHFDLICSGHTHEALWQMQGETHLLNPGALEKTPAPSVAILEQPSMRLRTERV